MVQLTQVNVFILDRVIKANLSVYLLLQMLQEYFPF